MSEKNVTKSQSEHVLTLSNGLSTATSYISTNLTPESLSSDQLLQDESFMQEALIEADKAASIGEVPIGAVVVFEGKIIARAHNLRETSLDPSAHAEFAAMIQASKKLNRWRLSGCSVYVTLEPCLMCAGLMINSRIDRCVYGAPDPKGGALGTLYNVSHDVRLNHEFEVVQGVLQQECADKLSNFFRDLRRRRKNEKRAVRKNEQ